jgi:hypothetical protein
VPDRPRLPDQGVEQVQAVVGIESVELTLFATVGAAGVTGSALDEGNAPVGWDALLSVFGVLFRHGKDGAVGFATPRVIDVPGREGVDEGESGSSRRFQPSEAFASSMTRTQASSVDVVSMVTMFAA